MTRLSRASRCVAALAVAALALVPAGANAQTSRGNAPVSFDVDASAIPILIGVSAPSALPLDAAAGVGFSGAKLNSQPKGTAQAAPGYVPLAGALPLLGGPGALPGVAARLLPGLLVGFPTIVGLPPVPLDPRLVPSPDVPVFPSPPLPPIECFANAPGEDESVACGGPTDDIVGFRLGAASGTATASGDPNDVSTLRVDSAVRGGGFGAAPSNTVVPVSAGSIASAATSYVHQGRVVAGVSTAVQDLRLFSAIEIPSMQTSLSAALDGKPENAAVDGERCTITGARVAGVPVTIDGDGVHVVEENRPLGDVVGLGNKLVQSTLDQLGVTLKTISGPADPGGAQSKAFPGTLELSSDGSKLAASLACLQVGYRVPTSGSVFTFTFGVAAIKMQAFNPTPRAPTTTGGGSGATPSLSSGSSSVGTSLGAAAAPRPPAAPSPGAGAPAPSSATFQQVGFGWRLPYPPFALLALSLPLAIWSRRVPPLHRPRLSLAALKSVRRS